MPSRADPFSEPKHGGQGGIFAQGSVWTEVSLRLEEIWFRIKGGVTENHPEKTSEFSESADRINSPSI
jgi:hypothetical protein